MRPIRTRTRTLPRRRYEIYASPSLILNPTRPRAPAQVSVMAPLGHTSTHAPHPQHASAFTLAVASPSVIASVGHTGWQAPHGVQAASSTTATPAACSTCVCSVATAASVKIPCSRGVDNGEPTAGCARTGAPPFTCAWTRFCIRRPRPPPPAHLRPRPLPHPRP